MSEVLPTEKLQPCLLDRLTDRNPEARQESRLERIMKPSEYRASVLRDLSWLLNTNAHPPEEFEGFEEINQSVLNYGTIDLCGQTASSLNLYELEQRIKAALRIFEPRINPDSIVVKAFVDENIERPNALAIEIRGELWANPQPESLHLRTELDLETGQLKV